MAKQAKLKVRLISYTKRSQATVGYTSTIEHASFTFAIEGISRACSHQLVRHRIASYSQQSQRYVDLSRKPLPYIIPSNIKNNPKAKRIFLRGLEKVESI